MATMSGGATVAREWTRYPKKGQEKTNQERPLGIWSIPIPTLTALKVCPLPRGITRGYLSLVPRAGHAHVLLQLPVVDLQAHAGCPRWVLVQGDPAARTL